MSSFNRWPAISLLAIALPFIALSCSDEDGPAPEGADGQAGDGGESPGPAAGQSGAGGATPAVAFICGVAADVGRCDPISGAACDVANGETCDHSEALGGFDCFADSPAKAGEFCDNATVFCGVGTFCNTDLSACQHYCCVDQDCGEGICFRGYFADGEAEVGICSYEYGGGCLYELEDAVGCDAGGAGGAGSTGGVGGVGGAGG